MGRKLRIFAIMLITAINPTMVTSGGEQLAMPVPAAPYAEYAHAIGEEHGYQGATGATSKDNRRCQSCFLRDATRGVVATERQWAMRICNVCATSLAMDTLALGPRCEQCSRGAVFGVELTSSTSVRSRGSAVRCGRHKLEGDTDVKHRRCTRPDCGRQALRTNGVFLCAFHRSQVKSKPGEGAGRGSSALSRAKGPKCLAELCQRTPGYGEKGGQPVYCAAHRLAHHVDLKNKRCLHASPDGAECKTQGTFGNPMQPHLRFCKLHRMPHHIDLRNKKCRHAEGCSRTPSFGNASTGVARQLTSEVDSRYCKQHRRAGHVMIVRKMSCQHPQGCSSQARYGTPQSGPRFCIRHCNPTEHISLLSRRNTTGTAAGTRPGPHGAAWQGLDFKFDDAGQGDFDEQAESNELSVLEFGSDEEVAGMSPGAEEQVRAEIAAQMQHSDFANISSLAWEYLTDGDRNRRHGHADTSTQMSRWDEMTETELEQELMARGVPVKPYKALLLHSLDLLASRKIPLRPRKSFR